MHEAYVGIGSNIEPLSRLRQAVDLLGARFPGLRASSVYRSPPHGFKGPDFLNMVVRFASTLEPQPLQAILAEIEYRGGRIRHGTHSRTLDLDLLLYGRRVDAERRLPRADVLRYPFVLAPLAEFSPGLVHPVTGDVVADAWARMAQPGQALERLGPIEKL